MKKSGLVIAALGLAFAAAPALASMELAGKAAAALPAQPKGVVQITPPAGKTVQAKFN